MIWLKLQSERVRVEKEYLIWLFNLRESERQRHRDWWVWEQREHSHSTETPPFIESTTAVSERFESKRIQEKNKFDSFKIRCFSKVQNGVVWTVIVFFIIIIYNNRPNLVPAKICISAGICRNCPKWPETARNLTRDGTGGGYSSTGLHTGTKNFGHSGPNRTESITMGQTHVNGWSRVITSQNGGSTDYIFPLKLGVL